MGLHGHSGPGVLGKVSLYVNSLSAFFCRISIFSKSVLKAGSQTSIAYIICEYIKL